MKNNKAGFTLIEMIFCISVILVILLLVIPNVTSKNNVVKGKGCEAQVEVVNSQIILYQIEHDELPTSISQLTSGSNPLPHSKTSYMSKWKIYLYIKWTSLCIRRDLQLLRCYSFCLLQSFYHHFV